MKNNMIRFSMLMLLFVAMFAACSRETILPETNAPHAALNPGQDFTFVGDLHNIVLKDLPNDPSFPSMILTHDVNTTAAVCAASLNAVSPGYLSANYPVSGKDAVDVYDAIAKSDDFTQLGAELLANRDITADDNQYFAALDAIMEVNATKDAADYHAQLAALETDIRKDSRLSDAGRGGLLCGIAVMNYSYDFWMGVRADGPSNPWYAIENCRGNGGGGPARMHWFIRDGMGAVGGFIVGFLVMGGNPIGAGVGAVVGGAAASAAGR